MIRTLLLEQAKMICHALYGYYLAAADYGEGREGWPRGRSPLDGPTATFPHDRTTRMLYSALVARQLEAR